MLCNKEQSNLSHSLSVCARRKQDLSPSPPVLRKYDINPSLRRSTRYPMYCANTMASYLYPQGGITRRSTISFASLLSPRHLAFVIGAVFAADIQQDRCVDRQAAGQCLAVLEQQHGSPHRGYMKGYNANGYESDPDAEGSCGRIHAVKKAEQSGNGKTITEQICRGR